MLGHQWGQMGLGDQRATGRAPDGHFLNRLDSRMTGCPHSG